MATMFDPNAPLPDFETQQATVAQQRRIAEALRKTAQGSSMPQGQMTSGIYVAPSWTQYLAPLLNQYQAGHAERTADTAEKTYTTGLSQAKKQWLENPPEDIPQKTAPYMAPGVEGEEAIPGVQTITQRAQPVDEERVLKHTLAGMLPGNEKNAVIYNTSMQSKLTREDKQKADRETQLANLQERGRIADQNSRDNRYRAEEQAEWRRRSDETKLLIAQMHEAGLSQGRALAQSVAQARQDAKREADERKAAVEPSSRSKERQKLQTDIENARNRVTTMEEAKALVQKATGSGLGALADRAAGTVGVTLPGGAEIAELQSMEGRLLAYQPKYGGATSNQDVKDYKQAAANIGNPSTPPEIKQKAVETIQRLWHEDYQRSVKLANKFNAGSGDVLPTIDIGDAPRFTPPRRSRAAAGPVTPVAPAPFDPSQWKPK